MLNTFNSFKTINFLYVLQMSLELINVSTLFGGKATLLATLAER